MKTIAEMRDRLAQIKTEIEGFDAKAKAETRALTTDEQSKYDALLTEGEGLVSSIEAEEKRTAQLGKITGALTGLVPKGAPAVHVRSDRPYSLIRAIRAMVPGPDQGSALKDADVEVRASDELAEFNSKRPNGLFVPHRALLSQEVEQRVVGKANPNTTGAAGIQTDLLVNELVELFRNEAMVGRMGARILPGLVGDVSIPRQSAGASAAFVANEDTAVSESSLTLNNISMTPKTVGLKSTITRRMLLQASVGIEEMVREDIRQAVALAIDQAAINGSGAGGAPTGIITTAGIGGVTTAGAITRAHLLEFESDLGAANALKGRLGFLMRSAVRAILKAKVQVTNQAFFFMQDDGTLAGYPSGVTEQMPASNLLFGNWQEVLIGLWSGLDMFADPYSVGDKGHVVLRGFQDADVAVRHAASFSLATDVTG